MSDPGYFESKTGWAGQRRVGDLVAVFHSGEIVRCPATRRTRDGIQVVCGEGRDTVDHGTRVTVRADRRAVDRQTGALNRVCTNCKAKLRIEVEVVPVATRTAA